MDELKRCDVTGNPCGTDTRPVGSPCQCGTCKEMTDELKPPHENVTEEMLSAAVKKAVEVGMIAKYVSEDEYLVNWDRIEKMLQAGIDAWNTRKEGA